MNSQGGFRLRGGVWPATLLVLALLGACLPAPAPTPTLVVMLSPPSATNTLAPTAPPATAEPTEAPATVAPDATVGAGPAIHSFSVQVEDAPAGGKRLTFAWSTSGAASVRIVSGAAQRFQVQFPVGASGTQTVEWADTYYANPAMTLIAADEEGHEVSKSVTADWPCRYSYFFPSPPVACPLYEPTLTEAAEQLFEHGRMLWLREQRRAETVIGPQVLVFFDDGVCHQYDDTWVEGEPASDPAIVPPEGHLQPVRGFGKVWRERPEVRGKLGWATAPEQSYEAAWQPQMRESLPGVFYVRMRDGSVLEVWSTGGASGGWKALLP